MPSHANKSTKVAALQLRKAGKSFPFIAKQLNCNERTLKRWVKAAGAGTCSPRGRTCSPTSVTVPRGELRLCWRLTVASPNTKDFGPTTIGLFQDHLSCKEIVLPWLKFKANIQFSPYFLFCLVKASNLVDS